MKIAVDGISDTVNVKGYVGFVNVHIIRSRKVCDTLLFANLEKKDECTK
jgi:hypothetical protein